MANACNRLGMAILILFRICVYGYEVRKERFFMKADKIFKSIFIFITVAAVVASSAHAARLKDIASIGGVRDNQLIGYGLVVGLDGTGDSIKNGFTDQTLANMLSNQGLSMKDKTLKSDNVAAVMVTAKLPPFAKIGSRIDIMISSIGDADSLLGGTLLMTPLRGADNKIYAVAQGPITVGGFSAGGTGGGVSKNHPTVGRITNGAFVERELWYGFDKKRKLTVNLRHPDFTTCERVAKSIRSRVHDVEAKLIDSSSIEILIKDSFNGSIVSLVSVIENLDAAVDSAAVVVLNEKTGTVVMGNRVRISTVAVAHGNLSIQITETQNVSQPLPFAPAAPAGGTPVDAGGGTTMAPGGQTVVTTDTSVNVSEEKKKLVLVPEGVTIQEVVSALNAIGVSSRDLIVILQTIKAAGALQADLVII
jgi:flagellar P-ring protein precursor FlgI